MQQSILFQKIVELMVEVFDAGQQARGLNSLCHLSDPFGQGRLVLLRQMLHGRGKQGTQLWFSFVVFVPNDTVRVRLSRVLIFFCGIPVS